jgi:hypothetical protein
MNATAPPSPTIADSERADVIAVLKRRRKFWEDLTGFVAVNGVLWLIWVLTDRTTDGSIPWPAWVSAVWGFLLALGALRAFGRWPGTRAITDAEIERELRRRRGA